MDAPEETQPLPCTSKPLPCGHVAGMFWHAMELFVSPRPRIGRSMLQVRTREHRYSKSSITARTSSVRLCLISEFCPFDVNKSYPSTMTAKPLYLQAVPQRNNTSHRSVHRTIPYRRRRSTCLSSQEFWCTTFYLPVDAHILLTPDTARFESNGRQDVQPSFLQDSFGSLLQLASYGHRGPRLQMWQHIPDTLGNLLSIPSDIIQHWLGTDWSSHEPWCLQLLTATTSKNTRVIPQESPHSANLEKILAHICRTLLGTWPLRCKSRSS